MKKFLVLVGMLLVTNVANAKFEHYASVKLGIGDLTMYTHGHHELGDDLVDIFEEETGLPGFKYSDMGWLWDGSAAIGFDWSPGKMYVKKNPYDWFHLRLEGEFGYNNYRGNGKLRQNYEVRDKTKVKYDHFFALVNGYADFRIDDFVPYFGVGIGYSTGKKELQIRGVDVIGGKASNNINDDGLIYALHLGLGYKCSDITTLDFGVKKVYAPAEDNGMDVFDTVRLGARFRI